MGFILRLFGGFRLFRQTGESIFLPERAQAMLAFLAIATGPVERQAIAEALSENDSEPDQRTALRQAIYLARKATADDVLLSVDRSLMLNSDQLEIDVKVFKAAIAKGDRESLANALELYRGPFLQGAKSQSPAFEEWLQSERAALLDYALDSLLKLAQLDAVDGLYGRALAYARRALELDPLREDAHRQVMRCLAAMNQRSKALRQYEAARQLLASELGVSPEEETQTLHKEIIQGRGGLADRTLVSAAMPVNPKFVKVGPRRLRARLGMPSRLAAALTFTFFAIIIANVAWHVQHQSSLTELPSIAVMPFTNAGGNRLRPTGMTEEITTLLTTNPGVEVVANDKLPKLARLLRPEPDPRFRLQGSVHASDQGLQVNVQLIDAATGTHLWADRLQAEGASLDAMEEQLAYRIYESLVGFTGEIARQEQRLAWSKPENSLEAYDYAMRGLQFALQAGKESQLKALAAYQQGLKKFPNSTRLRFYLAFAYRRIVEAGWSETPDRDLETAWKLAVEASLSPHRSRYEQWLSHWIMAKLAQWCKADFERSVAEAMAADKMVPYDATTRADLAELMANAGRTAEAIAWLQESIRRDPLGPEWYRNNLAWAYYLAGRYEDALAEMQALNKPRRLLIAAIYARLGRSKEARAMMVRYLAELPQQTLRNEARWPLVEPLKSGWLADLRQAGLPQ